LLSHTARNSFTTVNVNVDAESFGIASHPALSRTPQKCSGAECLVLSTSSAVFCRNLTGEHLYPFRCCSQAAKLTAMKWP